tara:strand:+ start:273 stop:848 length:576 start_codon:yes stop_codon:yes gene_type:complete
MDALTLAAIGGAISSVTKAVQLCRQGLDSAKDISEIAGSIDRLMTSHDNAKKAIRAKNKAKSKKPSPWEKLIRFKLGAEGDDDPTSLASIASIEIQERQMAQQIKSLSIAVNKRFGADCWDTIIEKQAEAKAKQKKRLAEGKKLADERRAREALQQRSLLKKIAIESGKVIIVGLFLVGMVLLLMHLKASN